MDAMIRVEAHDKKNYECNKHNKWEENSNAIAPDTKIEGDGKIMDVMLRVEAYAAVLTKIECNYSSVVGMLLYLAGYTHPDIVYTVAMFRTILCLEYWYLKKHH